MGIFDRLGSIASTDVGKAFDTAHEHFQQRLNTHGHFGRALLESLAETARNHPSLFGIGVGVLVEQLLVHEKHQHETELAEAARNGSAPPPAPAETPAPQRAPPHAPHHELRLWHMKPGKLAFEVFGALLLLKFGVAAAKAFSHKRPALAPIARIHLFSATIATYLVAKTLKSHEVSAWRNGFIGLFATDALKPLLSPDFSRPPPKPHAPLKSELQPPPARPPMQEQQPLVFH